MTLKILLRFNLLQLQKLDKNDGFLKFISGTFTYEKKENGVILEFSSNSFTQPFFAVGYIIANPAYNEPGNFRSMITGNFCRK